MKIKTIKFCSLFLYVLLIFQLVSAFPISFGNKNETLIVKDSDATTGLPDRFRDLTNLNISGSAQFTPSQIENIKSSINKPDICIVDLRQESHGFINDLAISFYSIGKDLNNGFTTEETVSTEDKLLNSIKQNSQISIYDKLGKVLTNITVDSVSTENNAINKNGLKYQRFAVKDGGIPSATVIDDFVDFIKNKPEGQHLHFHCDAGEGRTTTFMVLYQIMTKLKETCDKWKKETGIGFGLYGTPLESTTYKFAEKLKERFGVIEGITDKNYITNSYHVNVKEKISGFDKLEFESQFQKLSSGGAVSYIEIPNLQKNLEVIHEIVEFIYDHIQYAELNTKSDYCQVCGFEGEILTDENLEWYCPNCGNRDHDKMNVSRRTCGYLGDNFWNLGRTEDIHDRVLHFDNEDVE